MFQNHPNASQKGEFSLLRLKELISRTDSLREDSYLYSLPYYALTGRRGAWVCQGFDSVCVVCAHPHLQDTHLLYPELGDADGRLSLSVLSAWPPARGPIQLARFTTADIRNLRSRISQNTACPVKAIVEIDEPEMDWRFPLHILDTGRVAAMQGPDYRNVRQKCRKITGTVEVIPLDGTDSLRYIRSCLKYWEGNMFLRREDWHEDNAAFYHHLLTLMEAWPEMFDGYAMMYEGKVRGFTVWDSPVPHTANLLANITDVTIAGFSEYQMVTTCRLLADKGKTRLNRGGSESRGLDSFKQKFAPVKSLSLCSARVEYQSDSMPVSVLPLVAPDWRQA